MKSLRSKCFFAAGLVVAMFCVQSAAAQFMPVVYDNIYGKANQFATATADFQSGDVVMTSNNGDRVVATWLDRDGNSRFSKSFNADEFSSVSRVIPMSDTKVLLVGTRKPALKDKHRQTGRAVVLGINGGVERIINVGDDGTDIHNGQFTAGGNLILWGDTPNPKGGTSAFVCKVAANGKVLYSHTAGVGETCDWVNIVGSRTEYINAAFSSVNKEGSSIVRLDENGKPYFITIIPDSTFKIEKMVSSVDGDVYIVGQGKKVGGTVIKIRPEGDIVFQNQIVPASPDTKLDKLILGPTGELLVGGNDTRSAYFSLLRPDGTVLSSNVDRGVVAGAACNVATGDCIVSLYSPEQQGKVVKISKQGRRLYEKFAAANYTDLRINLNGDLLMAAPATGRLTMLSNLGELLFDRYVIENTPQQFADAYLPVNGSAIFAGMDSRVAKLAHGVYVGDVLVNKPINDYTTAVFTVTLSGYSFSPEGAPQPVTVKYNTKPITASAGVNYDPVTGTISFVPSTDGSDRYLNKFTVEVPVKANDLLEGERSFGLDLSGVQNSYLIRANSVGVIEDQPAIVKMISTTPGVEGQSDITYTLGVFKTNGTPLTNATKADIVIDGIYGKGTADKLDFDMGRMPRLTIAPGKHSGQFNVVTLEDTRYEAVKTVVIDFNKVYAMSDTNVSFGANLLSCSGLVYDQPAMVVIESLGDHTKLNNSVSGLFKVSLVRASDGALLTNNSGGDIFLTVEVDNGSTAKQGTDFVLANSHDLRIWGDNRSSAVNLNGLVLYTTSEDQKTVSVSLTGVKSDDNAGKLTVSPDRNKAKFTITNK